MTVRLMDDISGSDIFRANPTWGRDRDSWPPGPCADCGQRVAQLPRLFPRRCWQCFPDNANP